MAVSANIALATSVPVLKLRANPLVVAKLDVVALTALATNVPVLNVTAKPAVVAYPTCVPDVLTILTAVATSVPVLNA